MKPEVSVSTILATKGNEEMQDTIVMPRGVISTFLPSGLGNTMWRSPCSWEKFPGYCMGRGGMDVKWVMDRRGQAIRPLWRPETHPRQQRVLVPGHHSVFLSDLAFSNSTEGRWVLVEDHSWQCQASSCGFPGMASGCAEVGEICLFDEILMNEGASP